MKTLGLLPRTPYKGNETCTEIAQSTHARPNKQINIVLGGTRLTDYWKIFIGRIGVLRGVLGLGRCCFPFPGGVQTVGF